MLTYYFPKLCHPDFETILRFPSAKLIPLGSALFIQRVVYPRQISPFLDDASDLVQANIMR